ncbi:DNA-binding protein [Aeromonas veronii]
MAGSSSDLHSIREIWVTIADCENLPGLPTSKTSQYTRNAIRKRLDCKAKRVPGTKRKAVGKGKALEYRADLLPLQAQRALLEMMSGSKIEYSPAPCQSPAGIFEQLREASGHKLFSDPDEMLGDGLNLLSVLNQFMAECSCFNRVAVADAIMHAEGLIRAGHALSKTEGGAA